MTVQLPRPCCRTASRVGMIFASAIAAIAWPGAVGMPSAFGGEVACGTAMGMQRMESTAECDRSLDVDSQYEEELCGWATHDSCPATYPPIATRTWYSFDESIAAVADSACARAIVSVRQIVEPFATVGPKVVDSINRVEEFQQWWQATMAEARQSQPAALHPEAEIANPEAEIANDESTPRDSIGSVFDSWSDCGGSILDPVVNAPFLIDQRIDRLTLDEPVDVHSWGKSVLVVDDEPFASPQPDPVNIPDASIAQIGASAVIVSIDDEPFASTQRDPAIIPDAATAQAGASAVIVSIGDSYWPYDLSAQDLRVWSVFPLETEPFCIRSGRDTQVSARCWDSLDQGTTEPIIAMSAQPSVAILRPAAEVAAVTDATRQPECSSVGLLDQLVWNVTRALDEYQQLNDWLRPDGIGKQIAVIAVRARRVAVTATERIAGVWPESPPVVEVKPRTAGERLLVRAGAIEAAEPTAGSRWTTPAAAIAEAAARIVR